MRTCKHCDIELASNWRNNACPVCKNGMERYGLDRAGQKQLLESQNNRCALCEEHVELHSGKRDFTGTIDHDHNTGRVRGVLCSHCNVALGKIEKKNIDRFIKNVKEYLQE